MLLKELTMKNFKSYKDTTIKFNEGTTIITGENGAGKSTILEAIYYALYKKNSKNLIRHNTTNMLVELTFMEHGQTYKVVRTRHNDKNHSQLYHILNCNEEILSDSNTETDNMVNEITGMDSDLFMNSTYIRQGEMTGIITKNPSERKKLISRLLGIDALESSWEKMAELMKEYENRKYLLEGEAHDKDRIIKELLSTDEELVLLEKNYELLDKEEQEIQKNMLKVSDDLDKMDDMKTQHSLLLNNLENEGNELKRLENENVALTIKEDELHENARMVHMLEESLSKISVDVLKSSLDDSRDENNYCKQQNEELQKRLNELEQTDGECPICKSKIKEKDKEQLIQEYTTTISLNDSTIKSNLPKMKEMEKTLNEAEYQQHKIIKLKATLEEQEEIHEKIIKNKKSRQRQETEIKKIKQQINDTQFNNEKYLQLKGQKNELDNKIRDTIKDKGIIQGKIKQSRIQLENLKKQQEHQQDTQAELGKVKEYIKALGDIREAYGKNGVQRMIRANVKPLIQKYTRENFERFNFQYTDLELDDDYHITVNNGNDENSIHMLSGGEQISIALALRLGITKTISSGKSECIILDEPTNHLDNVRVHELAELFSGTNIMPQTIIVTHDEEFEKIADTLIRVMKNDGISEIT